MKTLILYGSKYGCTEKCAEVLKKKLGAGVDAVNVKEMRGELSDGYDRIILGSSIYIGRISKELAAYMERHTDILKEKCTGIFLCCGFEHEAETYFKQNYSSELLENVKSKKVFGGEAQLEKMSFVDKMITKAALGKEVPHIHEQKIEEFIREIEK